MTTPGLSGDALLLENACADFAEQGEGALELGEHRELLARFTKEITNRRLAKLKSASPHGPLPLVEDESPETLAAFLRVLRISRQVPRLG